MRLGDGAHATGCQSRELPVLRHHLEMLLTEHTRSYTDTGGEGRRGTEIKKKKKGREERKEGCERREGEQITAGIGRLVGMLEGRKKKNTETWGGEE